MEKDYKEMWECMYRYFEYKVDNAENSDTMILFTFLRLLMKSVENFGVGVLNVVLDIASKSELKK